MTLKDRLVAGRWRCRALLALLMGGQVERDAAPLHAAARCLMRQQLATGDWPQQHISGVFNRNCMITYANYRCLDGAVRCMCPLEAHRCAHTRASASACA